MEKILEECYAMQEFLEITTTDDPEELVVRLTDINVYLARSGKLLADAKNLQDYAIAKAFEEHAGAISKFPASIAQKFINSQCREANFLVNWLDRINATCKHQGDNVRTQISYAKELLRLTKSGY